MRLIALAALALASLPAAPALAGDSSGFDPAAIDQCLADSPGATCATAGMQFCLDYVQKEHPDVASAERELGCLDASHQAWEARLTQIYDALLDRAAENSPETQAAVREMERAWIAFRDARCAMAARLSGDTAAEPSCLRDEVARHAALLQAYVEATRE
ncbi:MAG: lysozyme inhibitor LprI family protein [Paracoccus sp. (in: a-proteobacteria)]|uniref:lysozyme inhibitor LprI family protein n=1 Tax=Paracoccus sp. TaxID=267 RepID=UPI0026DEA1EB|nr:lysozyme inhibitor LprI family protein [Paracoccus sp. (in: a-proteobacteria)]MDO5631432.1 lysozyme inhibitor LprI family protein [Paracoccus sp. (in: a-proteobacteria)]